MRTNFFAVFERDGPLDFTEDFDFFVFISGLSFFNVSNPLYHTKDRLALRNTLPVRTAVRTKRLSGLARTKLGWEWGLER
jgi:hypothetical protein